MLRRVGVLGGILGLLGLLAWLVWLSFASDLEAEYWCTFTHFIYTICMYAAGLFASLGVITSTYKYLRLNVTTDDKLFELQFAMETTRFTNGWTYTLLSLTLLCWAGPLYILSRSIAAGIVCFFLFLLFCIVLQFVIYHIERAWENETARKSTSNADDFVLTLPDHGDIEAGSAFPAVSQKRKSRQRGFLPFSRK